MMNVEEILAKLVSFPILGGQSNMTILNWIKEYLEFYKVEVNLVPNKKAEIKPRYIAELDHQKREVLFYQDIWMLFQ